MAPGGNSDSGKLAAGMESGKFAGAVVSGCGLSWRGGVAPIRLPELTFSVLGGGKLTGGNIAGD